MERIYTEHLGQQLKKDCAIYLGRVKKKAVCCCEGRAQSQTGPDIEVQTPRVLVTVLIVEVQREKCFLKRSLKKDNLKVIESQFMMAETLRGE